jgi:hypothetical protein
MKKGARVPGFFLKEQDIVRPCRKLQEARIKSLAITSVGTHDVSLITIDDGVFEVKATAGDTHLGKISMVSCY